LARHCGLNVCAVSIVVNYAAGMTEQHITHEETLHYTKEAAGEVCKLLKAWVTKVAAQ
jgi:purine nucleoside phosphorylase